MRLIELSANTGFAGGVNIGIGHAAGDWVLCVNNDTTVAPEAVEELLRIAEASGGEIGAVAAQMVFADRPGVINSAGIVVDRLGVASDRLLGEPVAASEREPGRGVRRQRGGGALSQGDARGGAVRAHLLCVLRGRRRRLEGAHARLAVLVRAECGCASSPLGDGSTRIAAQVLLDRTQPNSRPRQERVGPATSAVRPGDARVGSRLRRRSCSPEIGRARRYEGASTGFAPGAQTGARRPRTDAASTSGVPRVQRRAPTSAGWALRARPPS